MPVRRDDNAPPILATAAWSTPLPRGYVRIAISRGPLPERTDLNTMRYPVLTPNVSARHTEPGLFHRLYVDRLATLDPEFVIADIQRMGGRLIPVLCSFAGIAGIAGGHTGCHRHLAADWFERNLDIKVPEIGASASFDRFTWWRKHPIAPSVPGDRPRTFTSVLPDKKTTKALRRLAQGSFKF